MTLPIISLAKLLHGPERDTEIARLRQVTHEIGFFYLADHGIPAELQAEMFTVAEEFFALPQEAKLILTLCYVRPKRGNLERLMEALGVEKTRIYEKRNAALRKFALAWAGDAGAEK